MSRTHWTSRTPYTVAAGVRKQFLADLLVVQKIAYLIEVERQCVESVTARVTQLDKNTGHSERFLVEAPNELQMEGTVLVVHVSRIKHHVCLAQGTRHAAKSAHLVDFKRCTQVHENLQKSDS